MTGEERGAAQGTVESLYPFLYAGTSDLPAVLADVRESTVAKVAEITQLRRVMAGRDGARLAVRASERARRLVGGDVGVARQIAAFGRPDDIAMALSTSGNSENLLRACDEASRRGMLTVG